VTSAAHSDSNHAKNSETNQSGERQAKAKTKSDRRAGGDRSIRGWFHQAPWEQNAHAPDLDDETRRPDENGVFGGIRRKRWWTP